MLPGLCLECYLRKAQGSFICFCGYSLSGMWACHISPSCPSFDSIWVVSTWVIVMNNTPKSHLQMFVKVYSFLLESLSPMLNVYLAFWGSIRLIFLSGSIILTSTSRIWIFVNVSRFLASNCYSLWLAVSLLSPSPSHFETRSYYKTWLLCKLLSSPDWPWLCSGPLGSGLPSVEITGKSCYT